MSRSVGVSNTRTSPNAILLRPCLDLRVSEPNVIFIPIVNVPAEIIEQELAQGHVVSFRARICFAIIQHSGLVPCSSATLAHSSIAASRAILSASRSRSISTAWVSQLGQRRGLPIGMSFIGKSAIVLFPYLKAKGVQCGAEIFYIFIPVLEHRIVGVFYR